MESSSRHHVLFEKRWYHTPLEKHVRNHYGLLVPMYLQPHRELHANVQPPPKPNQRLLLATAELLDNLPNSTLANPPQVVLAVAEDMLGRDDKLAQRIGHNLLEQSGYIEEGYYSR